MAQGQVVEKRKERRIKVRIPIRILNQKGQEILGNTENLSRLGTYIEADKDIPPGSEVDISLSIPKYKKDASLAGEVRCAGSVFRSGLIKETESKKHYGIGIFFVDFPKDSDRQKLSSYLDFLILREDKEIKESVQYWQEKRRFVQETRRSRKPEPEEQGSLSQSEVLSLLRHILDKVEEIHRLLQPESKGKTK